MYVILYEEKSSYNARSDLNKVCRTFFRYIKKVLFEYNTVLYLFHVWLIEKKYIYMHWSILLYFMRFRFSAKCFTNFILFVCVDWNGICFYFQIVQLNIFDLPHFFSTNVLLSCRPLQPVMSGTISRCYVASVCGWYTAK